MGSAGEYLLPEEWEIRKGVVLFAPTAVKVKLALLELCTRLQLETGFEQRPPHGNIRRGTCGPSILARSEKREMTNVSVGYIGDRTIARGLKQPCANGDISNRALSSSACIGCELLYSVCHERKRASKDYSRYLSVRLATSIMCLAYRYVFVSPSPPRR
jgi:hypothetical protein